MAYIRHQEATGLGLDITKTLTATAKVVEDPALPEIVCNVLRLNRVVEGSSPGPPCARRSYPPSIRTRGVGLHRAITPLRLTTWAHERPALAALAVAGVVGGLVGIGYILGRGR